MADRPDPHHGLGHGHDDDHDDRGGHDLEVTPFRPEVPEAVLADLRDRLARTRLPNQVAGAGWDQGTERGYLEDLLASWRTFDWRSVEARLGAFDQFVTEVDGQRIHFVHQRSPEPDALPLLISHGWPGSVLEFLDVIGPLTDPRSHGGDPADAFHVVAPSLPGYGFSGPTSAPGWHPRRIASAYARLMAALGHDRYGAQGGDWGSIVCANVADLDPAHVAGLHLNFLAVPRPEGADPADLPAADLADLARTAEWRRTGAGYQEIQGTKPQSLGYGLEDSPAGLAGWIVEKFGAWSDGAPDPEAAFTREQLLANLTLYWVTATATSSTRLYYEMRRMGRAALPQAFVGVPTGVANYPGEVTRTPRSWAERRYHITHWVEQPRGGHFAAMQVPDLFVADVREFFRTVRVGA
ncbi:MAG: epoxide hydrolase family protein [Actinomycetota bacterium]